VRRTGPDAAIRRDLEVSHEMRRSRFLIQLLLCAAIGLAAVTPAGAAPPTAPPNLDPSAHIHPLLQYGISVEPSKQVSVIVQKADPAAKADELAKVVGGKVIEEFEVIPAFVVNLPQAAVTDLARLGAVRYVSPDGPVRKHAARDRTPDPSRLETTFPLSTGATQAWSAGATGAGVTVAVVDTGVSADHPDLGKTVDGVGVNPVDKSKDDTYGHGTHVAGIIAGASPNQKYSGIAPHANVLSVRISDDAGKAYESDLLRGLEWVYKNQDGKHIRVVNLSVSVGIPESYATSPIDAAVERLWNKGVVVVAAAGNLGSAEDAVWYAPANDPRIITVGCLDDNGTAQPTDDSLCPISSRGLTEDGFAKPDVVAPGRRILSALTKGGGVLGREFANRITPDGNHIRLSGTSMAAPMVAGAVALILDKYPNLTPDQVKGLLVGTARDYPGQADHACALDIGAAFQAALAGRIPTGQPWLVPAGGVPPAIGANTLLWDGARWGNTYWDGARWGSAYWDGARWGGAHWDGARWGNAYWDGARWGSAYWDGARWGGSSWDTALTFD
jgi:serine protease AprX